MRNMGANIASELLKIQAVKLSPDNPFTWASGLRSPIYCDNRTTLSFPDARIKVKEGFSALIKQEFPTIGGIAGVATAGIPHGALIADALGLPFIYIRSKAKEHGLGNQIEGRLDPELEYVVVEDLVSTGGSSLKAIQALRDAGGKVLGLVSIFTYGFEQAKQAFEEVNVPFFSLTDLQELLETAVENEYIRRADQTVLEHWRKDPQSWSVNYQSV